jgi:hypothetical protein
LPHFSVGLTGHHTLAFISRIFCRKYTCVFIESERVKFTKGKKNCRLNYFCCKKYRFARSCAAKDF